MQPDVKTERDLVNSWPSDVEVVYEIKAPRDMSLCTAPLDKPQWKPPANVHGDTRKKKPWER
jgi:hypothetical protein